ncbi:unnamed protein product [Brassicogethes aeneus]|uniref:Ig-like domain-containing protein n=1 Tax=Brassicogethes aeneus TaxID=1431903 RepID=A0A9P0B012_BRAAE|nr:unnamed protein product [Brassicogethes aeneus]
MRHSHNHSTSIVLLVLVLVAETINPAVAERRNADHSKHHKDANGRMQRSHKSIKSPENAKPHNEVTNKKVAVVQAQTGTVAVLHCKIKHNNVTVLWLKKQGNDSFTLLTVNASTHSWDKRFYASNEKDNKDWTLHIMYPKESDQGLYECQIFTEPKTRVFVKLELIEARAEIFGGSPKIVKAGSPLRLSCVLRRSIDPPMYIFWYHEDRMINYDLMGGAAVRHGRQGSELVIPRAEPEHAGNYSCVPSNARQVSVLVDVKHGHSKKVCQHIFIKLLIFFKVKSRLQSSLEQRRQP